MYRSMYRIVVDCLVVNVVVVVVIVFWGRPSFGITNVLRLNNQGLTRLIRLFYYRTRK